MFSEAESRKSAPKTGLLYRLYARRLRNQIVAERIPHHVAVIVDGNRRWAAQRQLERASVGHRAGAQKVPELLGWCEEAGIDVVTLYLLSSDNLSNRHSVELQELFEIIAALAAELAKNPNRRVQHVGSKEALPAELVAALEAAEAAGDSHNAETPTLHINLAVGYGGRKEIASAVHSIIDEHQAAGGNLDSLADILTPELIGEHLYTGGQADPDLVIRTSGEQRLSGFLLWQSAYSEMWFTEAHWPDFRRVDFLRALRDFSRRHRRFGA